MSCTFIKRLVISESLIDCTCLNFAGIFYIQRPHRHKTAAIRESSCPNSVIKFALMHYCWPSLVGRCRELILEIEFRPSFFPLLRAGINSPAVFLYRRIAQTLFSRSHWITNFRVYFPSCAEIRRTICARGLLYFVAFRGGALFHNLFIENFPTSRESLSTSSLSARWLSQWRDSRERLG